MRIGVGAVAPALAGAVAMALAASNNLGRLPFLSDNQHYFYMAERTASGVPAFTAHVDPTGALNALIEGAGMALGRALGVGDVVAARLVSITLLAVAVALACRLAAVLTGSTFGGAFAALAVLSAVPFVRHAAMSGQPKVALVAFSLAALLADHTGWAVFSGALAGCVFLSYQPGLVVLAALVVAHLAGGRGWRVALRTCLGFGVPIVAYEAYFFALGGLRQQIACNVVLPVVYMHGSLESWPYYRQALGLWWSTYGVGSGVALLAIATWLGQWWTSVRRAGLRSALRTRWLPTHLAGAAMVAYHLYDHQGVPDTFRVLPFVALVAAQGAVAGVSWLRGRAEVMAPLAQVVAIGALLFLVAARLPPRPAAFELASQLALGREVASQLGEGGGVWAVGCTHLLAFNHAGNWLPYGFTFRGVVDFLAAESGRSAFTPEREGAWPRYILVSRGLPAGSEQWLPAHYDDVTPAGFAAQGIQVFRRRAAAP